LPVYTAFPFHDGQEKYASSTILGAMLQINFLQKEKLKIMFSTGY
jgi:hypothetical protein